MFLRRYFARAPSFPARTCQRSITFTKVEPKVPEEVEEKKICDPFNNQGKPFDDQQVSYFTRILSPKWKYDPDKKVLIRHFDFKPSYNKMESLTEKPRQPGTHVYSDTVGAGGCFSFASILNNICTNTDHWVYSMTVTPRKSEIEVQLKTISRGGLTQADINIALQLDMLMKTRFKFTRDSDN